MKKIDLKKLALMGITGGVMLTTQSLNGALPSQQSGLNPDELLAARSWTCRKGTCGMKSKPSCKANNGCKGNNGCKTTNGGNNGSSNGDKNSCKAPNGCSGPNGCKPTNGTNGESSYRTTRYNNEVGMTNSSKWSNKNQGKGGCGDNKCGGYKGTDDKEVGMTNSSKRNTQNQGKGGGCGGKSGCGGGMNHGEAVNENEFVKLLNEEGRRLYNTLDADGKKLALRLSKQYSDKNAAVKHAVRQSERQNNQTTQGTDNATKRQQYMR